MGKSRGPVEEETDQFEPREVLTIVDFLPRDLLDEITSLGWRASESAQEITLCKMHAVWRAFTAEQRYEAFGNTRAHVNRLVIEPGGEEAKWKLFNQIMTLPDEVTVRRALLWDPAKWAPYKPEDWEKDYLELPGFVGEFVNCYKESSVPAPFFAWAAIALIGVCCKYNLYVQAGGEELLHNLYVFFVGDSAVGKSYAKNCATNIIEILNNKLNNDIPQATGPGGVPNSWEYPRPDLWVNQLSQDGTYEGGIARLAAIRKTPIKRMLTGSDGVPGLSHTGEFADAAAVLVVDEVSEHFGRGDWAADKKVAGYTAMYTGKSRSKSTVGAGEVFYDRQAFSMMVCGAVEWFKGAVTPAMLHGGFMDRSLFLYRKGTNRIYTALDMPIIDPIRESALADKLIPIAVAPDRMRRRVHITDGAREFLSTVSQAEFQKEIDIRNQKIAGDNVYKSSAVRREHQKIKVASILALAEMTAPGAALHTAYITKENMELSEFLLTNEDKNFQNFLDAVNMTGAMVFNKWIYDQFMQSDFDPIPQRRFLSKAQRVAKFDIQTVEDLQRKLGILMEGGVVRMSKMATPGKKGQAAKQTVVYKSSKDQELWGPYLP